MKYSFGDIWTGLNQPKLLLEELERLYYTTTDNGAGIQIFDEDWDFLVILDACRYDTFVNTVEFSGEIRKAKSKASSTEEFLETNFSGRKVTDTVYVTANPQFYRIENGIYNSGPINCDFYDVVNVWKDNWDDEYRTVRPEVVTDAAIKSANDNPNKRIIIHYLQPHAPYIGPTGQQLPTDVLDFWHQYTRGEFDINLDAVHQAYQENLDMVLSDIERLFSNIKGKFVLTADHGEMLGERSGLFPTRKYGHPSGIYTPELVDIPWFIYENGNREEPISEDPTHNTNTNVSESEVRQRLEDLGYVN